jgi:hypothetical protein
MDKETIILKVGDVLYHRQYGQIQGRIVIDRTTKCYAFSGTTKFNILQKDSVIYSVPYERSQGSYVIPDDKTKEEFNRKCLMLEVKSLMSDLNKLTNGQLEMLIQTLKK